MTTLQKLTPEASLRIGLGLMYCYSAWDIFVHPTSWLWAIPPWFTRLITPLMSIETYLRIQAISEGIIALVFLAWFLKPVLVKYIALLATIEMAGILLLGKTGIDQITFRDLGLLGALGALVLLLHVRSHTTSLNSQQRPHG